MHLSINWQAGLIRPYALKPFAGMNYLSYAGRDALYGSRQKPVIQDRDVFRYGGFADHRELPSGDDDLFINKIARRKNTRVVTDSNSFMYSAPKETWTDWKYQKQRHLSTARYYRPLHKFFLSLQPVTQILVYLLLPLAVWKDPAFWYVPAGLFLFRWIINRILYTSVMRKLDEKDLVPFIEVFDLLQVFYYFRFFKAAVVKTRYRWN